MPYGNRYHREGEGPRDVRRIFGMVMFKKGVDNQKVELAGPQGFS